MKTPRHLIYTLLLLLSTTSLFAQADWQWGQEVRVNAKHISIDNFGNSYVTWSLENSYTIDGENFVSNGSSDAALTSFDCDGVHRWTKTIGGQSGDAAWGLGTDSLGGVYLACQVNSSRQDNYELSIDIDTTLSIGRRGYLFLKYDTDGALEWFRMPEDTVVFNLPDDLVLGGPLDMDVAPNGDCYIYSKLFPGIYGDGAFEATFEATLDSGSDVYALKYSSEGNCTGGVHFDMYYADLALAFLNITRDPYTGNFYMSDNLNLDDEIMIFGGEQVTAENYLVQFDPDGFVNWTISADDTGVGPTGFVGKPSVDELGNAYVTGYSYNDNSLGDFTFNNTLATNGFSIFAKIDSMGNVVYASNASSNNDNSGLATAYSNGKIAVTGTWVGQISWEPINEEDADSQGFDVYLNLFDVAGDGSPESFHSLTSSPLGAEDPSILTSDRQGNFYVGGDFSGQLEVGEDTLYNQSGASEGFIAKFGTDSCFCSLPEAAFMVDSLPNQAEYLFEYTGTAEVDSVVWDFGDGTTGNGLSLEHLFAETGTYTVCATAYNDCGPDSVCITIDALGPVGVKAIEGFENILLYPNPAKDMLTIGNATPGTRVAVINAVGQQMQSALILSNTSQMDISSLPPGVYLLQMIDVDDKVGYARFVRAK
jgi:hypothetical protein